jgi:3'(2'), 5'-bisphosphate nucleotidase
MPSLDLNPILAAVRQAAQLCIEVQKRHIVKHEKVGHEPVTIADYGSQAIICRALKAHYPDDAVMSEESGRQFMALVNDEQRAQITALINEVIGENVDEDTVRAWLDQGKSTDAPRTWVIDPIDGTKGFLAQRHYVNAVGILQDRVPVGGVLGAPAYPGQYNGGALLYALDGEAFIESLMPSDDRRPMTVSAQADMAQLRALESVEKGHAGLTRLARAREIAGMDNHLVEQADSMEKYGRVAAGDADVYMRLPRLGSTRPHNIWDHAPGVAILEAAGGKATDVDGSPLDFGEGNALKNYGVIASNGTQHDALLEAVSKLLEEEKKQA